MRKVIIAIVIMFWGLPLCAINSSCYRNSAFDDKSNNAMLTTKDNLSRQLFEAVLENDTSRVAMLLNNGADPNSQTNGIPPLAAICFGRQDERTVNIINSLLKAGANPNYLCKGLTYTNAPYSTTPLMALPGWEGEITKSAKLLIEHGADINLSNELGETPAFVALAQDLSLDMVYYLIVTQNAKVPKIVKTHWIYKRGPN